MSLFDRPPAASLASRLHPGRHAAPLIPADWCPDRPAPERIARLLLSRSYPDLHYAATAPETVLAALADGFPGNQIPDVLAERERLLRAETARTAVVLRYLVEVTGLAEVGLREVS